MPSAAYFIPQDDPKKKPAQQPWQPFADDSVYKSPSPLRDAGLASTDPFKVYDQTDKRINDFSKTETMSGTLSAPRTITDVPQASGPSSYDLQLLGPAPKVSDRWRDWQEQAQKEALARAQGQGPSQAPQMVRQQAEAALQGQLGAAAGMRGGNSQLNALLAARAAAPAYGDVSRIGASQRAQEMAQGQQLFGQLGAQQYSQDLDIATRNAALDQATKLFNAEAEQNRFTTLGAGANRINRANADALNEAAVANARAELEAKRRRGNAITTQAGLLGGTTAGRMGLLNSEIIRQNLIRDAENQLRYKIGASEQAKEKAKEDAAVFGITGAMKGIPVFGGIVGGLGETAYTLNR